MNNEHDIDTIIFDLLDSIGLTHRICKLIRELDSARSDLLHYTDNSGDKAKKVIALHASLQKKLVEATDLRQEEDLATAIQVATEQLFDRDYNEFFGDNVPGADSD